MSTVLLPDTAATLAFAARLAGALPAAHTQPIYVALRGELGAGKTTFVQGFLAALGVRGAVHSPSYALVEAYQAAGRQLVHVDLYRLAAGSDFEELGLRELFTTGALWLVEWPEKAGAQLPDPDLDLQFQVLDTGRKCVLAAHTAFGLEWLQAVGALGSDQDSRA